MVVAIRGYLQRGKRWLAIEPTEEFDSCTQCEPTENEGESPVLQNYQITYVKPNGATVTELIAADEVYSDDLLEFWLGGIAQLMVDASAVQQVRNVSALDMPL